MGVVASEHSPCWDVELATLDLVVQSRSKPNSRGLDLGYGVWGYASWVHETPLSLGLRTKSGPQMFNQAAVQGESSDTNPPCLNRR